MAETGLLSLSGNESRHLARSLRGKEGDIILVGDGRGTRYRAGIVRIEPGIVDGEIESVEWCEPEVPLVSLFQAVSRLGHMDETVSRVAEAGGDRLVPFMSPRSRGRDLKKSRGRIERWRSIARESSKVARRAWPLVVDPPSGWPPAAGLLDRQELNVVLWEGELECGLSDVLPDTALASVGILVGPEGVFSPGDVEVLREAGAVTASLGELILRTESAGSYVVMLVRYRYGILQPRGY